MKKFLLSMAAVAALGAAASPAAAQVYGRGYDHDGRYDYSGRYDQIGRGDNLEMRIDRSLRTGQITPREAWRLRADLRQVQRLEWRYTRDGRLSGWERADLDRRYDAVRMELRHERYDRDYGYGYGPGWR